MDAYVVGLRQIDKTSFKLAGGKGAHLGELSRIKGINVSDGFCISTEAYKRVTEHNKELNALLDELEGTKAKEREDITKISARIRILIERISIPGDIVKEITGYLAKFGEHDAFAVRSSATAEDLPTASFAGQQDTYLNIIGKNNIFTHIGKCWASLFTDRAVTYRKQTGFDDRHQSLAVIVQKMVFPQASGILFTSDPITSNRKVLSIDASFGLGEALVSGLVSADNYKVKDEKVVEKMIAAKKIAIYGKKEGGTNTKQIEPGQQKAQTLTEEQILQLSRIGRKIEANFNYPQDIEWCLADDTFYIVQSRPITTLYPIPEANDQENHVYVSVGHQQMMTDAMKPLGLSFFLLTTRARMTKAGGRLFVDITPILASPGGRRTIIETLGQSDPLIRDALTSIIARGDFIKTIGNDAKPGQVLPDYKTLKDYDPAVASDLIRRSEDSLEELNRNIQTKSGEALIEFILEDIQQFKKSLSDPQSFGVIMTAMNAASWVNEKMNEWLGEKNVADTLSQSAPNNITSEMGLALLDVADVIRPYPEVINYLQHVENDTFLVELGRFNGGNDARDAIHSYLNKYGMRCVGEIDITRPRWSEKPSALVPTILSNIKNFEPGASDRKFEQGRQEALKKEHALLERLKQLPGGEQKAEETKRMISLIRNFAGYREYPKYSIVSRYFVYKKALLKEAERLVRNNTIDDREDIYYLTFEELGDVVRTNAFDKQIISKRKEEYRSYEKLTPPRVITSDGEIIVSKYKRENLPAGAIAGLPVSSGVVEGRARIILNMEDADLGPEDILVTRFTDPSWTPLFVSIKALVTEVGGLMTHGAVIAREYGLPAVVGVENATTLVKEGQRIRVNGTEGYIKVL